MKHFVIECKVKKSIDFPEPHGTLVKGAVVTVSSSEKKGVLKLWGFEGWIWAVDEDCFDVENPVTIIK